LGIYSTHNLLQKNVKKKNRFFGSEKGKPPLNLKIAKNHFIKKYETLMHITVSTISK